MGFTERLQRGLTLHDMGNSWIDLVLEMMAPGASNPRTRREFESQAVCLTVFLARPWQSKMVHRVPVRVIIQTGQARAHHLMYDTENALVAQGASVAQLRYSCIHTMAHVG